MKINTGFKASIAYFISSIITSGISYLTTPIFTRLLNSEEYGSASIFFTWLNIFGIIAMFSFGNGVFNNGLSDYPNERNEFSFSLLVLSNIVTCVFAFIIFIFGRPISNLTKVDLPFLWLMVAVFLTQPAYNFWFVRQRFEYQYKKSAIFSIILALFAPFSAIISVLVFNQHRLYARVFGAEISFILWYIGFYLYIGRKAKWKIDSKYWKSCFLFNLPLIPHYLSMYLLNSCDKLMISKMVSDSATAYYSVAYSVAALATIVWSAVNGSLVPFTYTNCKEKRFERIEKVTTPLLILFGATCIGVILIAPEVVFFMAPTQYSEAIYAIPPIIGGVFFQVQYHLYANVVYYYKKTRYVMYASFVSAIVNIILNYFGIKAFGYLAAGYTTLICFALQALIDYFAMRGIVKEKVYNTKVILALSAFIIVISVTCNRIYNYAVIRYILILLIILLAVIYRKIIGKTIKDIVIKR